MNIHRSLRICIQDCLSEIGIHLLGTDRITLVGTTAVYLECEVFVLINLSDIIHNDFLQVLEVLLLNLKHRADPRDTENALKCLNHLIVIVIADCLHIDTSGFLGNLERSLYFFECYLDLVNQGILKQIPVLSLCSDLCILNQK